MKVFRTVALIITSGMLLMGMVSAASLSRSSQANLAAATTLSHLVVLYQENDSFDHYFATYPVAQNPSGEPGFTALPNTPPVNGLNNSLLSPNNPNSAQPFRLGRSQAVTCDQDHRYTDEQKAYDAGLMDKFPEILGVANTITVGIPPNTTKVPCDYGHGKSLVMGYYDGNTVTALWNYAQHFALSDNTYETGFGPSTPGNVNLISGQTHGFTPDGKAVTVNDTIIGDPQPAGDICDTRDTSMQLPASTDRNIGDLLNAQNVTWGWFQGGFRETSGMSVVNGQPTTNSCLIGHANMAGVVSADYIAHHEPFQFYKSTQNLLHLPPSSVSMIGKTDRANHQYDLSDFWKSVDAGSMPAVSFLKASAYQDGHPAYSDPLDEQRSLVETINRLQHSREWKNTAVVVVWDDSDGWYDHQMGPIVNQSNDPNADALQGGNNCGTNPNAASGGYQDRCGYGPRVPLLLISPWSRHNFVDHAVTDQSSILRFIEDYWHTGRIGDGSLDAKAGSMIDMFDFSHRGEGNSDRLFLNPSTGEPASPGES